MAHRSIRKLDRIEKVRTVRGWCVGLGIVVWAMALTLLPIGLGNPKAVTNSVIPALTTTWSFGWLILPLVLIGAGFFLVALVLNQLLDE